MDKIVVVHYLYMLIHSNIFCLVCEYYCQVQPESWSDINFLGDSKLSVLWPRHV